MKRVLAISGGVDSMVMLELMARKFPAAELIVAHFDHGTRESARTDADFVKAAAERLGVELRTARAELGEGAAEATARAARYDFLRRVAASCAGEIYTAHHLDDLVETVAINLVRGTGWRGLAALDAQGVRRPFLEDWRELGFAEVPDKHALMIWAARNDVRFREDPTNNSDAYLRNRLRTRLKGGDGVGELEPRPVSSRAERLQIYELWQRQKVLRRAIDAEVASLLPEKTWQREWFKRLDEATALELLRAGTLRAQIGATRPQLKELLQAIRDYAPGKSFNLPQDRLVKLTKCEFEL